MHAVCSEPPYGILEFTEKELGKLPAGRGGVWRLPPKVGGSHRDPLLRFAVLTDSMSNSTNMERDAPQGQLAFALAETSPLHKSGEMKKSKTSRR